MENYYTYISLDTRQQGIRCDDIGEGCPRIDDGGRFLRRLLHFKVVVAVPIPEHLLPPCSAAQRPHLGRLDIASELWPAILSHVTDLTSAACFGAAHPLLAQCALERMRDIQTSLTGVGAWAGQRVALINVRYCYPLPREAYTDEERKEYAVERKGSYHGKKFMELGNEQGAEHRDEWRVRGGEYAFDAIFREVKEAIYRWQNSDANPKAPRRRPRDAKPSVIDYERVRRYLDHTEHVQGDRYEVTVGDYVLCNETKREYVLTESVARFSSSCKYVGPRVEGSWTLGDTAGFLVACDKERLGEGRWAGDRVLVTTVKFMRDMEGSGEWKNIGMFEGDTGFEGKELWKSIKKTVGKLYTYGGRDWKENYAA